MSDALPLPARPNLEQYKKLAKDVLRGEASEPLAMLWQKFDKPDSCKLTQAQFFLARAHGFQSWPQFANHLEALESAGSPVSQFETAADAIVAGDLKLLESLVREHASLVTARSTREHRSTLLHYVSANGIEDFRQKTPPNIVEIARLLLDAGADVNAESDAYGGRSTTLMLTATSGHPEAAGVQIPLMSLLLERGAKIGDTVNACLRNGRGLAAGWLADHGAQLDLEGAAGVGRVSEVRQLFNDPSDEQKRHGLAWACEFGHFEVVEFLLGQGVAVTVPDERPTALHWAAYGGHTEIVKLLIGREAPVNTRENRFGGTPLDWALHGWRANPHEGFYTVVADLVRAGAAVPDGFDVKGDPRMEAALRPLK